MSRVLSREAGKVHNATQQRFKTLVSHPVGRAMVKKARFTGKECPYYRSVDVTGYERAVIIRGLNTDGIPKSMASMVRGLENRRWLVQNEYFWNTNFKYWQKNVNTCEESQEAADVAQAALKVFIGVHVSKHSSLIDSIIQRSVGVPVQDLLLNE